MTNEPEQVEDGQSPVEEVQSQVNEAIAKLSGPGEPLIALGAVFVLVADLFGNVIFDEYSLSYMGWLPGVLVVIAVVAYRFANVELPTDYGRLLAALAFVGGVMMIRELIADLDNEIFDADGATMFFALVGWIGGAFLLVGAWQVWSSMSDDS